MTDNPVITIDGPSGTGKGTISALLAQKLGWHWLDSGSIYRAMAWVLLQLDEQPKTAEATVACVQAANIEVGSTLEHGLSKAWAKVDGRSLGDEIRTEACSQMASKISVIPGLRALVLEYQRAFAQPPGLVTDGRDMGTVVFPAAALKIFMTAEPEVRARRRQKQLQDKGVSANLADILAEIEQRDERDASRATAPTIAADDAVEVDTSHLNIEEALNRVWCEVETRGLDKL
jgi:cytidylate kinase